MRFVFLGLLALIGTLSLLTRPSEAKLHIRLSGVDLELNAPQLFYDGYWAHPGWINGTLVNAAEDVEGKIALFLDQSGSYERHLRSAVRRGAIAAVFWRRTSVTPGQAMYFVDGHEQKSINIPVVDLAQKSSSKLPLLKSLPAGGLSVQIYPDPNPWKRVADTKFQFVMNIILTLWELGAMGLAVWKMYKFRQDEGFTIFSIAQLCLILEFISLTIRACYTFIDPFWTYRLMTHIPSGVLLSASVPFALSSGILLTFFWAETLLVNHIEATPFISKFKKIAIAALIVLFVGEISTSIARIVGSGSTTSRFITATISILYYVIVTVVLFVAYMLCAVRIIQRVGFSGARNSQIRRMTLRFGASALGYIVTLVGLIMLATVAGSPWGFRIAANLLYISLNWTATWQIWGFQRVKPRSKSTSKSDSGGGSSTNLL